MRAGVEGDLSTTAQRVVRKAESAGWSVVAVASDSVADEDGQVEGDSREARSSERVLSLRGRRTGGGRFVVLFVGGSVESVWWWTRQHSAIVKGYRAVERTTRINSYTVNIGTKLEHDPELDEVVEWQAERPSWRRLGTLAELVGVAGGKRPRPGLLETFDSDST